MGIPQIPLGEIRVFHRSKCSKEPPDFIVGTRQDELQMVAGPFHDHAVSQARANFVEVGAQTFEAQPGWKHLRLGVQPLDQRFDGVMNPAFAI